MVQPSSMDIPGQEFLNMARLCKLSTGVLYATFLGKLIREAQQDPHLRDAMKGVGQIIYTGVALQKEEEAWAFANNMNIVVCTYSCA